MDAFTGGASEIEDGSTLRLPRTSSGRERNHAIRHFADLRARLPGVHVWCCAADTITGAPWIPPTGFSPLPSLREFDGRMAVYGPAFRAQDQLLGKSDDLPEADRHLITDDFKILIDLVYGPGQRS